MAKGKQSKKPAGVKKSTTAIPKPSKAVKPGKIPKPSTKPGKAGGKKSGGY